MKSLAKKVVLGSGLLKLAATVRQNGAAILMYHSVRRDPPAAVDLLGGISHKEEVFRGQMELLARSFRPLTLDLLADHLRAGRELPPRSVVVTFDDGYADNHETALPILNRIGVPAVFYIAVDCIEKRRLPWPARLRFCFQASRKNSWRDPTGRQWDLTNNGAREKAFACSSETCCCLTGNAQDDFVAKVERDLEVAAPVETGRLMMTYEQIGDLERQGHLVGSHTMSHPNMAYVTGEEAAAELNESKKRLEQRLGSKVVHFSYPCPALSPHWNEFTAATSQRAGYETAVTTDPGLVGLGDNSLRLTRVRPTKTVDGLRWNLECAFAGRAV